ncbi:MAG: non-hydrolyzing UDP-N-acetylglucosamine 2-epimerase [Thermodesulfobacteriota bacterium]
MAIRNISILIGTRPEAIKLMPLIKTLQKTEMNTRVLITGQHRELLLPILSELDVSWTENMELMQENQSLTELSARILVSMAGVLKRHETDLLIVQGDTTSAAMSALACFYAGVKVAHVEAGLRTYSMRNPFPEEANRRMLACLADIHFPPTTGARDNLLNEGIDPAQIHMVGNTVVDALYMARDLLLPELTPDAEIEKTLSEGREIILVTGHRRESFGADFESICRGLRDIAEAFSGKVEIIYPMHLNPNVREKVVPMLSSVPNIRLIEPLSYLRFIEAMLKAKFIITDSGGVQEEAAALGIPVLVTRRTCERAEAVKAGVSQLVGPCRDKIFKAADELLTDSAAYVGRARPTDVFGDGHAAERIAEVLMKYDNDN